MMATLVQEKPKSKKISPEKKKKIALFDEWAKWYGDLYKKEDVKAIKRVEDLQSIHRLRIFLDYFPKNRKCRVIDVGCGTGPLLKALLKRGHDAYGCDYSKDMIEQTKRTLRHAGLDTSRAVCADLDFLDRFPAKSVDFVTASGLMRYLTVEEQILFYKKIQRVLKNNGRFLSTYTNGLFDLWTFNRYTVDFLERNILNYEPIKGCFNKTKIMREIRGLVTHPDEPPAKAHSLRDRNLVVLSNPLTIDEHVKKYNFAVLDKRFYSWEPLPTVLRKNNEAAYKKAHARLEMFNDRDWRGYFMSYEFFVCLKKIK